MLEGGQQGLKNVLSDVVDVIVEDVQRVLRLSEARICCWLVASFMPRAAG